MALLSAISHLIGCAITGRFDTILYKFNTRRLGLDLGFVSVDDLGLSKDRAHWCSDSGGPDLVRVIKALDIPKRTPAIDIGSGKGGAVLTIAKHLGGEVVGVEMAESLIRIAEENTRRSKCRNAHFIHSDAVHFSALDRFCLIYMYNPFPASVMARVMDNIRESMDRAPRRITLIYKNPTAHETVLSWRAFHHIRDYTFPRCTHKFSTYSTH